MCTLSEIKFASQNVRVHQPLSTIGNRKLYKINLLFSRVPHTTQEEIFSQSKQHSLQDKDGQETLFCMWNIFLVLGQDITDCMFDEKAVSPSVKLES